MDTQKEFSRMMAAQTEIALATCGDGCPNVRIVNFIFDEKPGILYFATFGDNKKVKELEANNQAAFTTIPKDGVAHIKARGTVQKSDQTIFDLQGAFSAKIKGYANTIAQAGAFLVVYEIHFDQAIVTLDFENISTIMLKP